MPRPRTSSRRRAPSVTELTLADRFIALAEEAESAGFSLAASSLIRLASLVFDEAASLRR